MLIKQWVGGPVMAAAMLVGAPALAQDGVLGNAVKLEVNLWEVVAALSYYSGFPDHENSDNALERFHDDVSDFNTRLEALSNHLDDDLMPLYETIYDDWGALQNTARDLLSGSGTADFTSFRIHAIWDQANVLDNRIEELVIAVSEQG